MLQLCEKTLAASTGGHVTPDPLSVKKKRSSVVREGRHSAAHKKRRERAVEKWERKGNWKGKYADPSGLSN